MFGGAIDGLDSRNHSCYNNHASRLANRRSSRNEKLDNMVNLANESISPM
jgi:hypothetical protein